MSAMWSDHAEFVDRLWFTISKLIDCVEFDELMLRKREEKYDVAYKDDVTHDLLKQSIEEAKSMLRHTVMRLIDYSTRKGSRDNPAIKSIFYGKEPFIHVRAVTDIWHYPVRYEVDRAGRKFEVNMGYWDFTIWEKGKSR